MSPVLCSVLLLLLHEHRIPGGDSIWEKSEPTFGFSEHKEERTDSVVDSERRREEAEDEEKDFPTFLY